MKKKIFLTFLIFSLLIISICSYSFATTNAINDVKNTVMNAGNAVGNTTVKAKDGIVNGATDITSGAKTLGNDTRNTIDTGIGTLNNADNNYTATRTNADNTNFLGMNSNTWTWVILAIVGIVIVALVWYFGAQYEHRNYQDGE